MVFFFGQDEGEGEIANLTSVIYDLNFFSLFLEKEGFHLKFTTLHF